MMCRFDDAATASNRHQIMTIDADTVEKSCAGNATCERRGMERQMLFVIADEEVLTASREIIYVVT